METWITNSESALDGVAVFGQFCIFFCKKTCVWYLFWSPSLTSSWPDKWTCQRKWFASLQTGWFSLTDKIFVTKKIRNEIVVSPFWWQAQEASCIRLQYYKDTMMHKLNIRIYQDFFSPISIFLSCGFCLDLCTLNFYLTRCIDIGLKIGNRHLNGEERNYK